MNKRSQLLPLCKIVFSGRRRFQNGDTALDHLDDN